MGMVKFRIRDRVMSIFLGIFILYIYFSLSVCLLFFLSIKHELQVTYIFFYFTTKLCQDNL